MKNKKGIKLLPCPFCGGKASDYIDIDLEHFYVTCEGCFVRTDLFVEKKESIKAWNKRVKCGKK